MTHFTTACLIIIAFLHTAKAQYAPGPGNPGSTAIHADSIVFVAWGENATINRSWQNCADTSLGKVSTGNDSAAFGKPDGITTVSLGDGGTATYHLNGILTNNSGPDFAVFENSFDGKFLELAFVEVSNDGFHFVRFPCYSKTDATIQTGPFGFTQPEHLHNLAGKYPARYGTPFDLEDLKDSANIDLNAIKHIRIVDVTGSVQPEFANKDNENNTINDPWPTAFSSGGFDLDGIGLIHYNATGIKEIKSEFYDWPSIKNPISSQKDIPLELFDDWKWFSSNGVLITEKKSNGTDVETNGLFYLSTSINNKQHTYTVIINHE